MKTTDAYWVCGQYCINEQESETIFCTSKCILSFIQCEVAAAMCRPRGTMFSHPLLHSGGHASGSHLWNMSPSAMCHFWTRVSKKWVCLLCPLISSLADKCTGHWGFRDYWSTIWKKSGSLSHCRSIYTTDLLHNEIQHLFNIYYV